MIDAIAFKELYKTVYQDLYRFALCMMHHPQDGRKFFCPFLQHFRLFYTLIYKEPVMRGGTL